MGDAVTGSDGRFTFQLSAGAYRLRASRLGYWTTTTEFVSLNPRSEASVRLRLAPSPVPLDTLTVAADPPLAGTRFPIWRRPASIAGSDWASAIF